MEAGCKEWSGCGSDTIMWAEIVGQRPFARTVTLTHVLVGLGTCDNMGTWVLDNGFVARGSPKWARVLFLHPLSRTFVRVALKSVWFENLFMGEDLCVQSWTRSCFPLLSPLINDSVLI